MPTLPAHPGAALSPTAHERLAVPPATRAVDGIPRLGAMVRLLVARATQLRCTVVETRPADLQAHAAWA